jgi:hypothetical protein
MAEFIIITFILVFPVAVAGITKSLPNIRYHISLKDSKKDMVTSMKNDLTCLGTRWYRTGALLEKQRPGQTGPQ